MRAFERLHPAVQHHVANSLGWRDLRPLQAAAIEPVLAGEHALLLAPTAGGKTEAAVLPLLSRMLTEDWRGLSVLYICPIKALINNLAQRLSGYAALVGRRAAAWHGDVGQAERRRIAREPPDILLATPESLEVILVSRKVDHRALLARVRAVVVDEIHAFAGDDRGWHLLAVLERIRHLAEVEPQRLGLSATVGNAGQLLGWLTAGSSGAGRVVDPAEPGAADIDVRVDHVGTLANAALVISRLHRGEKRLVFCDSRTQVENLAAELRRLEVATFVSHSSLSIDERRQAETAFAAGADCVIVATSTLELGVDVGDLDRVIQIGAPSTVAAFLQRVGRTGRRAGARRNCLFLAVTEESLLRALAVLRLWQAGYVEPVEPPPAPFHVLAQQLLALTLQEGRVGRATWIEWLGGFIASADIADADVEALVAHMLAERILVEDQGMLSMGPEGEAQYGARNFLELFSIFNSPPLFTVLHGRTEIGQVHQLSFQVRGEGPTVLTLGGRAWAVKHLDWPRRVAYVEPSDRKGRSRWLGSGQALGFELCQAVKGVLCDETAPPYLSRRAAAALEEAKEAHAWVRPDATTIVTHGAGLRWWTFGGRLLNASLAALVAGGGPSKRFDDFHIDLPPGTEVAELRARVQEWLAEAPAVSASHPDPGWTENLKFKECLPEAASSSLASRRLLPGKSATLTLCCERVVLAM